MNRRRFVIVLATALAAPLAAFAQSKPAILIAWLSINARETNAARLTALKDGLAALGWTDGSQITFEERWANGSPNRLTSMAEELAAKKPAIIVVSSVTAATAGAKAAPQTPIVLVSGGDLVQAKLAKSLAHPGGMVTGLTNTPVDLSEKHLELLMAAAPKLQRIGVLLDGTSSRRTQMTDLARQAAARYPVEIRIAEAASPDEVASAVSRLATAGVQALIIPSSGMLSTQQRRIAKIALEQRWPLIAFAQEWADSGALLAYGTDPLARYRRGAYYIDRILKGAKPGDLPIEQPTQFVLVVNLKTAKTLALAMPPSLLLQANRVIE